MLLRGGTYRITEPIVFGPEDGGTGEFTACQDAFYLCTNLEPVEGMVSLFHDARAQGNLDGSQKVGEFHFQRQRVLLVLDG